MVDQKSEYLRTEIPCAHCLKNLSMERGRDWVLCENPACGLAGPEKVMFTLTKMRALVTQAEGALITRREQVAGLASTIEKSCGNARCLVFHSGLILAPDNAPDAPCACTWEDLEKLVQVQAKAVHVLRGTT